MNKYKVIITQKEDFIIEVEAKDKQKATDKASDMFNNGDYGDIGNLEISIKEVIKL